MLYGIKTKFNSSTSVTIKRHVGFIGASLFCTNNRHFDGLLYSIIFADISLCAFCCRAFEMFFPFFRMFTQFTFHPFTPRTRCAALSRVKFQV